MSAQLHSNHVRQCHEHGVPIPVHFQQPDSSLAERPHDRALILGAPHSSRHRAVLLLHPAESPQASVHPQFNSYFSCFRGGSSDRCIRSEPRTPEHSWSHEVADGCTQIHNILEPLNPWPAAVRCLPAMVLPTDTHLMIYYVVQHRYWFPWRLPIYTCRPYLARSPHLRLSTLSCRPVLLCPPNCDTGLPQAYSHHQHLPIHQGHG